ncbi:hypothetical protein ACNTMW_31045 [Planosporangium sp. 12N6]|uniref:hypothetical protein n=1 Tax=Planosporangium spinosum TaxID=3402278 RepID=UPI003CEFB58C
MPLDWSDGRHWATTMRPCRCCGTGTHGRDEQGRPVHKSCAEAELASEIAGQLGRIDERALPSAGYRSPLGGER